MHDISDDLLTDQELDEYARLGLLDAPGVETWKSEWEIRRARLQRRRCLERELATLRNRVHHIREQSRPIEQNLGHDALPSDILIMGSDTGALVGTTTIKGREHRIFLPRHSRIGFLSSASAHELLGTLPSYRREGFRVSRAGTDVGDLTALLLSMGFRVDDLDSGAIFATACEGLESSDMARQWWATEVRAQRLWRADVIRATAMRYGLDDPFHNVAA